MRRRPFRTFLLAAAVVCVRVAAFADVLAGTWNLCWFPSGRAEHRASARVEAAATLDAADLIRGELARKGVGNHAVVFLQELRGEEACSNLTAALAGTGLRLANVSAFRGWDNRLDWQQTAILTDMPVLDAHFSYWRRQNKTLPPRGYSYALLDGGADGLIACFCVHLKSNYGARTADAARLNALKREISADQIVAQTKKIAAPDGRRVTRVIVAGDFNTSPFDHRFDGERTFPLLTDAGFVSCFPPGTPLADRATHPGKGRWPDSTLDDILHRGFAAADDRRLAPAVPTSDHRMLTLRLR